MINRNVRSQPHDRLERTRPGRDVDLVADSAARKRKLEQRPVRHERPSRLESREPAPRIEGGTRVHEYAHQAGRSTQAGEIREGIRTCRRRQPESAVEQAIPNLGRDEMVRLSYELEVVDLF